VIDTESISHRPLLSAPAFAPADRAATRRYSRLAEMPRAAQGGLRNQTGSPASLVALPKAVAQSPLGRNVSQKNRRSHPRPPGGPPVCQWGPRKPETPVPMLAQAVTRIWIEPLRHADGLPRCNSRGQLYRTRLGGPAGDVLVAQAVSPMCPSCRALMRRGITGRSLSLHAGRHRDHGGPDLGGKWHQVCPVQKLGTPPPLPECHFPGERVSASARE